MMLSRAARNAASTQWCAAAIKALRQKDGFRLLPHSTLINIAGPSRRLFCSSGCSLFASKSEAIPAFYPKLLRSQQQSSSTSASDSLPDVQVDHLVIGGGVVGLAVARQLALTFPDKTTFLVERHKQAGQETSSRNSEVIHAGIFYAPDSLKTNLCLRGRELLYKFCEDYGIPFRQTGKLVVGTRDSKAYLSGVLEHSRALANTSNNIGAAISGSRQPPSLQILTGDEARELEPDLGADVGWTLYSPRTGIVSSHEYMARLEQHILDSDNGEIVYDTNVVGIRPVSEGQTTANAGTSKRGDASNQGWVVETRTEGGEIDALLARHVINAGGLNAPAALNTLAEHNSFSSGPDRIGAWFSKGNYASYAKGKGGVNRVQRLIYPLPDMGSSSSKHGHQGLGTHLTLDLDGNIRFGPDTDWLRPPDALDQSEWWANNLVALQPTAATSNQSSEEERIAAMHASVSSFLPGIKIDGLAPNYAGIRPKLTGPGGGFVDFTVLWHSARNLDNQPILQTAFPRGSDTINGSEDSLREALFRGPVDPNRPQPSLLSLCGIESPGLTSSLAIAEIATLLIARRGWGEQGTAFMRKAKTPPGARNEDAGPLDAWA